MASTRGNPLLPKRPPKRIKRALVDVGNVPFVQETPDLVRVLILQLARGAWGTLARLLQVACLTLGYKPLLAHELAAAGATGVLLDVLYQAPRHHPAWRALSTAGAGLLATLACCEGGAEAAQPQALRLLLSLLESRLTCGPARQAVATALHSVVAQRTVHRDKLLAAGALPVLLRVLGRLDVLCDVVTVQEVLWTLAFLTDEGSLGPPRAGSGGADHHHQPGVAERLVPLLTLYGMPWHSQHGHMAALATRALHVQVAGHDLGKDLLRAAGVLPVLVNLVRRHALPYTAAAHMQPNGRHGGTAAGRGAPHAATAGSDGRSPRGWFAAEVAASRPGPHVGCGVHDGPFGAAQGDGAAKEGWPYSGGTVAALGPWTPWQRLLAVLLVQYGIVPALAPAVQRRTDKGTAGAAGGQSNGGAAKQAGGAADAGGASGSSTPSPVASDDDEPGAAVRGGAGRPGQGRSGGEIEAEADGEGQGVFGSTRVGDSAVAAGSGNGAATPDPAAARVLDGACLACYGLLLPLLVDAGDGGGGGGAGGGGGGGGPAGAGAGAEQRRRLCPLRESLATLKTLLCDCEANQVAAEQLGLVPLLVQLVAHGDMGLAWQAAEAAVYLSGGAAGAALVEAGAVEELAYLLQESADALHGLTLRKQIQQVQQAQHAQHAHPDAPSRHAHSNGGGGHAPSPAPAQPPPMASVHVRPSPHAAPRPGRLYLVGRLPLDFTTASACFYGSHDAATYCDYCTPSAAIKVLLRLTAAPTPPPAARGLAAGPVCVRFLAAGGLYGLLTLLHHEAAGVHHSKLAASLLTLLDLGLMHAPGAQDELRTAGGVGVLAALLGSLLRPGVMDVYQLRVALCRTIGLALQGNAANQLTAREHGLLPLLVSLVAGLAEQRRASSAELVLDDTAPLGAACLEALEAAVRGSAGSQDALVALGLLHPVCALLRDQQLDGQVRTAAVRLLAALADGHAAAQAGALALGAAPAAVAWLERCCGGMAAGPPAAGGLERASARARRGPDAGPARALAGLLGALLRGGGAHVRSALVSAGALPVLLHLMQAAAAAAPPDEEAAVLAAGVLAALAEGDTDVQNELVAAGALAAAGGVVRQGGVAAAAALALLSAVVRGNTYVKNTARQAGLPATLVEAVRRSGLGGGGGAAAAAAALAELAAGNHANQEAVAMSGGLEVAVELARDAVAAALPRAEAEQPQGGASWAQGAAHARGGGEGPDGGGEDAAAAAAASASRLLGALFGLVAACVELNAGNQGFVRELGGVTLVADFLMAATAALTAGAGAGAQRAQAGGLERARAAAAARVALAPAVAAACGAVAALVRESDANLARLEEQPGLPVALFQLLVASDAPTSSAAARALEWLVVRAATPLTLPSRAALELDLVDVLALALYVPYGMVQPYGNGAAAPYGAPQHPPPQRQGPWHVLVTGLMPPDGLGAGAVREAAAVLTAVADAADAVDAVQQQQQGPQQQQQQGKGPPGRAPAKAGVSPAQPPPPPQPSAPGSLPRLDAAASASFAASADHSAGLVLSLSLAGGGPGAEWAGGGGQARWAELAGRGAAAFQRVANGVLRAQEAAAGGGGGGGGAAAAAQERRCQVAWMLFLLAARSADNRARVRRLVRASLTPLALQLANAEACKAQLEAAAPPSHTPAPAAAAGGGGGPVAVTTSAALEGSSSVGGWLPVSTVALEDLSAAAASSLAASRTAAAPAPASGHSFSGGMRPPAHSVAPEGPTAPPAPSATAAASPAPIGAAAAAARAPSGGSGVTHGPSPHAPHAEAASRPASAGPTPPHSARDSRPASSSGAAAAAAATGGSGANTPRFSLSSAAAAAFAPSALYPAASALGRRSRGASPSPSTSSLGVGPTRAGAAGPDAAAAGDGSRGLRHSAEGVLPGASAAAAAAAGRDVGAAARGLHEQVSGGGSSGLMSDDDELSMIAQEVALLATTTSVLASGGGSGGGMGIRAAQQQQPSGLGQAHSTSSASSPGRWARR